MKRAQRQSANKPKGKSRVIEPSRLTGVRGGALGITVTVPDPDPHFMEQQHNETLVRL